MSSAVITGASRGLGYALARELALRGWKLAVDARDGAALAASVRTFENAASVTPIGGDISDPDHRSELAGWAERNGPIELLVNNASVLGPSPQPTLEHYPIDILREVFEVNTIAPLALIQDLLPQLSDRAIIVNVTSDAAVAPYEGWGGYGSSKAALDQLTAIMGAELPDLAVYAFDPGDMRTEMQQAAFPGEDISDRPEPETVIPAFIRLIDQRPRSGRYRAADLLVDMQGAIR